ncbi:MAG TPA: hypothetical protein VGX25_01655, partial [Actinophytocola sp.]|uniref:hypothetical protein n=1 Tax=Actinophytocola sp. TaxID=1872138 RepID=UPI002DDC92B9
MSDRGMLVTRVGPLAGLLDAVLPDPALTALIEAAGAPALEIEGTPAARPLVVAALATRTPVLVVTATGRGSDELTAALTDLLGP